MVMSLSLSSARPRAQILRDLFGGDVNTLERHAAAMLAGVSKTPKSADDEPLELEDVVADLTNASGLSEDDARLVKMLGDCAFVSHPTDKGNASWLTRAQLVERIKTLKPITDPSAIFATVLNPEDALALRAIVDEMQRRVGAQLDGGDFESAAATLRALFSIEVIDNVHVTRMVEGVKDSVFARARDVDRVAMEAVMRERCDNAESARAGPSRG